jgi:hypothetical protein
MTGNKLLQHALLSVILIVTAVIIITDGFTTPLLASTSCGFGPCTCQCETGSCYAIRVPTIPFHPSSPSIVGCYCGANPELESCRGITY